MSNVKAIARIRPCSEKDTCEKALMKVEDNQIMNLASKELFGFGRTFTHLRKGVR